MKVINEKHDTAVHFANLFNIWLHRRELDFHICLCLHSTVIMLSRLKYMKKS